MPRFSLKILVCFLIVTYSSLVFANGPVLEDRLNVRLGAFLINRFDTTARFDSRTIPVGTVISLEDSFNVDSSESVGRIDGYYRFSKRHRIDWSYYNSRRDGTSVAEQEIDIGDPDDPEGGITIPVGAQVDTRWNVDLLKVGYAWSFLNKPEYEWFIGGGLNVHTLDVEIAYDAGIGTVRETDRFDAVAKIPLPTATVGGRYNMGRRWHANMRYELFFLELGDYKGTRQDFQLSFEHNTFKNVGFGLGFNFIDMRLRASDEQLRGEFDSSMIGLLGFLKIYM
jgi:hypothetical protein